MRSTRPDDRTAAARIRDAAIACFADDGVAATSVRAVASRAGVSPALVIHHFGSKDALRVACDQHVAATIRDRKREAIVSGLAMDPVAALRRYGDDPPLLRYLARTLVDGSPHVAELVDEMVADAHAYMGEGVDAGMLKPSRMPWERAAVATIWSLGALVLHEHVARLTGADLTGSPEELARSNGYLGAAIEMFTDGLLTEEMAARLAAFAPDGRAGAEAAEDVEASRDDDESEAS